jgi:hypothetical protein
MVYTIIAEPRSGGTSLMDWIEKSLPNYVIAQEPYFIGNDHWVDGENTDDVEWINKYENLFIREIYRQDRKVDLLLEISDKVLCLYRDNWYDQVKSILYQEINDSQSYMTTYRKEHVDRLVTDKLIYEKYDYFVKTKNEFQQWIKTNNLLCVSYEDLYYGEGINVIKEFFNIDTSLNFPLSQRHLKDNSNNEVGLQVKPLTPTPTPTPTPTRSLI